MSNRNLKFFRVGLPFFTIIFGGAYGLHYFQQVRYDFRRIKQQDNNLSSLKTNLSEGGLKLRENVTVDSVYKEISNIDTDNWSNIRGPREFEDNSEYLTAKAEQQNRRLSELVLEINEGSGEPDDSASIRAERGSPTPSCVTLDATQSSPYPVFKTSDSDPAISTEINTVTVPTVSVTGATSDFTPNQEFLKVLLSLGFDEFISVLALKRTQNQGVEQAVDWIVEHSNPSDFEEEDSSSDESESEPEGEVEVESKLESEMGVASSAVSGTGAAGIQDSIMKAAMAVQKSARTHKMVLVANMGLKMGTGKLAAQVGHATLAVYRMADSSENGKVGLDSWFRRGQVKIVLKGKDTEELMDLFKSAKDAGLFAYLVQDAGYTQIPPGSRTVLAVFGEKDKVDSITGHLRLL